MFLDTYLIYILDIFDWFLDVFINVKQNFMSHDQSDDLKTKFKQYTIPVTIQCAGNKRKFMNDYEHLHGLPWEVSGGD